ncbi:MAG: hypothetical protein LT102_13065 [Burkholderiaceae bacterium]|nr:hypothetical protein [Burkholderiaceae bacterium]
MFESTEERNRLRDAEAAAGEAPDGGAGNESSYIQPGEDLSIRVRVVRTENQLRKAIKVRADAYLRHNVACAESLHAAEDDDKAPGSLVFLCESKVTGDAVGTLRIHTNFEAPTYLERNLRLPDFLRSTGIAYVTRLAIANGTSGTFVKLAMFKALHRYCFATQISWILAVAREPVDRDFVRLGFRDILSPGEKFRRPDDFGDMDVRPLYFSVLQAEHNWRMTKHPLYEFMALRTHPDIEVFTSVSSAWTTPRRDRRGRRKTDLTLTSTEILSV